MLDEKKSFFEVELDEEERADIESVIAEEAEKQYEVYAKEVTYNRGYVTAFNEEDAIMRAHEEFYEDESWQEVESSIDFMILGTDEREYYENKAAKLEARVAELESQNAKLIDTAIAFITLEDTKAYLEDEGDLAYNDDDIYNAIVKVCGEGMDKSDYYARV